jgi:Ulp1 family protease
MDSLGNPSKHITNNLIRLIASEGKHRYGKVVHPGRFQVFNAKVPIGLNSIKTQLLTELYQVPQQLNGVDCGIYMLHFCRIFTERPAKIGLSIEEDAKQVIEIEEDDAPLEANDFTMWRPGDIKGMRSELRRHMYQQEVARPDALEWLQQNLEMGEEDSAD